MISNEYCVFLDLLGFSNEIIKNSKAKTGNKHLLKFMTCYKKAKQYLEHDYTKNFKMKTFSDNIYINFKLIDDGESEFGRLVGSISRYQLEMTLSDFFVRGGWCFGETFIDDDFIYGAGLIRAHELEEAAKYPFISIDCEFFETIIKKHINYSSWENSPWVCPQFNDIMVFYENKKPKYFVNYLYAAIEFIDECPEDSLNLLKKHKEIIEKNLNQFIENPKIYSKYKWCAEYHNYFCSQFISNIDSTLYIDISKSEFNFETLENVIKK